MQKLSLHCIILLIFFTACHNKKGKENSTIINKEEPQSFFPVTNYILGQLNEIDSLPITPVKITTSNNKSDSIWLKKKDIRIFAQPFLQPAIDSVNLSNFFTEKSFMDQTINAITLSYDPKIKVPESIKLTHWDIYIDPQKNTVQRIYLVKEETVNGQPITTQLTWKANEWCSIRTITQQLQLPPQIKEEKMQWNFDE